MAKYTLIRASGIKQLCKEQNKQVKEDFLFALENFVRAKVLRCCSQFNGHRVRLDASLVELTK